MKHTLPLFVALLLVACAETSSVAPTAPPSGGAGARVLIPADGTSGIDVASTTSSEIAYLGEGVADRVFFAPHRADLTPEARAVLLAQAAWLQQSNSSLLIEGHGDTRGTSEYNLALGARRANAVRTFLINQGVAPDRLQTISYGKARPVSLCADATCWEKNSRVVSVVR